MPLTKKGKKILGSMKKQYGAKKGKQVFYASENKGNIKGVTIGSHNKKKLKRKKTGIADYMISKLKKK